MASLRFLTPFHIQIFTWGLISWSAFWASSPLNVDQSDSNRASCIKVLLAPWLWAILTSVKLLKPSSFTKCAFSLCNPRALCEPHIIGCFIFWSLSSRHLYDWWEPRLNVAECLNGDFLVKLEIWRVSDDLWGVKLLCYKQEVLVNWEEPLWKSMLNRGYFRTVRPSRQ